MIANYDLDHPDEPAEEAGTASGGRGAGGRSVGLGGGAAALVRQAAIDATPAA